MSNFKTQNQKDDSQTNIKLRAYKFSLTLIHFLSTIPNNQMISILSNQLLRSGISIGANIVEAKSSSSKRDFIRYYEIALKSSNETLYWLCLLRDSRLLNQETSISLNSLLKEAIEIGKMIGSSVLTLKKKKI